MKIELKYLLWGAILVCSTAPAFAQTPSGLTVKSATSKQIALTWNGTASSYSVQRAPLGGTFATIGTATSGTYADNSIDAYSTYQYQIVAGSSSPSNQVTVGPPPAGLSNAAPAPLIGNLPDEDYGYNLAMTLDGNGDPAFVFVWQDPNKDSVDTDDQLLFRSWNRAAYQWNPVVKIDTVGDIADNFQPSTSLAFDTSSSTWVAAAQNEAGGLNLYTSTNGTTWTKKNTFSVSEDAITGPSLRAANGNLYLAYMVNGVGATYVTGALSAAPGTWTTKVAPAVSGTGVRGNTAPSLALDGAGNPGIAYWVEDDNAEYNENLLYWKPAGSAAPVKIMDTQGQQTDDINIKLTYFNLNPRVVAAAQRQDADFGVLLHYSQSNDGGLTWSTPVVIPPDGNSSTNYPFDFTVGSQAQAAVAFGQNSGSGDATCGNPKISRSTDGVHFTTCAIAGTDITGNFGSYPGGVQVAFGGNDKLYLLWWENGDTQANTGILMFREPPANAVSGPIISSVADGASFRPNIVGGSWVTIKGTNLSDVTRSWGDSDFKGDGTLPTNLSGVQVKVNNIPAAVYYIANDQINFQAPSPINGSVQVQVIHNGATSNTVNANAVSVAPALFAYTAGTKLYPAAVYANSYTIVGDPAISGSVVAKAKPGDHIALYGTGLATSQSGTIITSAVVVPSTVTATVGSQAATVEFAGLVASGEFQINIVVPNLAPGEYPVTVSVGGQTSQSGVAIPVGQ